MQLLNLIVEGLTQPPSTASNLVSSLGLLLAVTVGPLPLFNEATIGAFLILQLVWTVLLYARSLLVVGSQSTHRALEAEAKAAALKWMDALRVACLGWVCKNVFDVELIVQICELYCGAIALRAILGPLAYAVIRVYGGADVATKPTGYDPSAFLASAGWGSAAHLASGPAWKQHGHDHTKITSGTKRESSLAPARVGGETKNNNDRCTVLDEGPHFNRTARGCLLRYEE